MPEDISPGVLARTDAHNRKRGFDLRTGSFRYAGRVAIAAAAAIVLASVALPAARAETAGPVAKSATAGTGASTDFSAARRRHNSAKAAAPAAAVTGTFTGTMGAIVSDPPRREPGGSYYAPRRYGEDPYQFYPTGP